MNQMNTPEADNVQEIDLVELAKRLWSERKFLFKCCGVAIVVGLVVAFSIPKEYSTTVKLAPETSDPSKKMGNLGGLAAMAGIQTVGCCERFILKGRGKEQYGVILFSSNKRAV